jgi:hypothetical protein
MKNKKKSLMQFRRRQLEIAFHQFEENCPSVANFEENQKKPEGCF